MSEPVVAIVVAAGSGVRLGGETPKALRELAGVPLVRRSVDAMAAGGCTQVFVVVAPDERPGFAEALAGTAIEVTLVDGGPRRQDSVGNGLARTKAEVILVQDAARPLVPASVVRSVIDAVVAGAQVVVPAIEIADSLRILDASGRAVPLDRTRVRLVQTPQGFRREALLGAHNYLAANCCEVTDDASAAELAGYEVTLVSGSVRALKITRPGDLVVAESFLIEEPRCE